MRRVCAVALFIGIFVAGTAYAKATKGQIQQGSAVSFDYVLTVDGKETDSSKKTGPLKIVQGAGQIIPGLDKALVGLKKGDEKTITIQPQEAYGMVDPKAFREVPRTMIPATVKPQPGMMLQLVNNDGRQAPVKIAQVKDKSVVLDLNHPLAGKVLVFKVRIVSVQ
jgi:FKBP-type peptidyl-prolyl cis-trans isomerase 2